MGTQISKPTHGSLKWLEVRHRDEQGKIRFGASEAPILMGVSKYQTLTDLALAKWSDPEVKEQNDAMVRGTVLEPALLDFASQVLGVKVTTPEVMYAQGRFIATLDGVTEAGSTIVEAKTTTAYSCDDPMPVEFFWQAVAQLACTDAEAVRFVVLDKRMRLAMPNHWVVYRDNVEDEIIQLEEVAEQVGQALDARKLPDGATMTETHVKMLYPDSHGTKELGTDGIVAVNEWQAARDAREYAEQIEREARDRLTAMLGEAEVGTVDGQKVVSYKSRSTGSRLDTKQLELDYPDLVAKYKKPAGTTRVLRSSLDGK